VTVFSWLWICWGAAFALIEGAALIIKDRPPTAVSGPQLRTLTANVRWLIAGAGPWHRVARTALVVLLAWLPVHFGLPGTDWRHVWPNLVANLIWAAPAAVGYFAHQVKARAVSEARHRSLLEAVRSNQPGETPADGSTSAALPPD
jgi:hypothetical protein